MPQTFAAITRVPPDLRPEFDELARDRATTVDAAMAWLHAHDVPRISHGAIGNYLRHIRSDGLFQLRPVLHLGNDSQTRHALKIWIDRLAGDDLSNLALYAAYLMNIRAAIDGKSLPRLRGLAYLRSGLAGHSGVSRSRKSNG